MVGISKNKNVDHWVKESCAVMSTQVTYKTGHISALCHLTMPSALIFFIILLWSKRKIS